MNRKVWLGLILLLSSYGQVLIPRRMVDEPSYVFFGYALIPGNPLAFFAALFTLGVIVIGEGICQRFGGASLWEYASGSGRRLLRVALTAAACGLTLELTGQWLGRLWIYPYWTDWFYALVVIPGFAFYWMSIVESYLAVKAVLDAVWRRDPRLGRAFGVPRKAFGVLGIACLVVAGWCFARWYAAHDWSLTVVRPAAQSPPFSYVLLAFAGGWLIAEALLSRRGNNSLLGSLATGYRVPAVAVLACSAVLSLVMETQNTLYHFWRYVHFPAPEVSLAGVPLTVLATWPLQYLTFLLMASVLTPGLAPLFWSPRRR